MNCRVFYILTILSITLPSLKAQPVWLQQTSGVSSYLQDIEFVSANVGYAVGINGVILKTTNGGTDWVQQTSGVSVDLYDCCFFSDQAGWACGANGIVLKTINGGTTWTSQVLSTPLEFKQINFIGLYAGVVVGKNTSTGYVDGYYSSDGGTVWSSLNTPPLITDVLDIEFTSVTTGFLVDNYEVYYTADAGLNWNIVSVPTAAQINRVEMFDALHGWMCGAGGTVLYTSDGGTNWVQQTTPVSNTLWGITIVNLSTVYISGANGCVISTNNAGADWVQNTTPTTETLPSISGVDATHVWTCGTNGVILKLDPIIDLEMISYDGPVTACPDVPFYISIGIKNIGEETLGTGTFSVIDGINTILTKPYTGGLMPGQDIVLNLGQISVSSNTILTINFSGDDVTTNNTLLQPIAIFSDQAYGTNTPVKVCPGGVAFLNAYGGLSYKWLNASPDSTAQTQHVVVYAETDYYVEIHQSNCVLMDTVKVVLNTTGDCKTTAFTPNGDGKNDFFYIENLPAGENEVTIFNRWGDELLRITNYDNVNTTWSGYDLTGKSVVEAVYFYVVKTSTDGPILEGWVQVIR